MDRGRGQKKVKEIVTLCFCLLLLFLNLSLLLSMKRLIRAAGAGRCAVGSVIYTVLGAASVFGGGVGTQKLYQAMLKTKAFLYIKENFLSGKNPQLLYFVLFLLLTNLIFVLGGLFIWLLTGKIPKKTTQKLPAPWAVVLGKWMWNLCSALVVLFAVQAIAGLVAVFFDIPGVSHQRQLQWAYGFWSLPAVLWFPFATAASALSYDPKRALEPVMEQIACTKKTEEENCEQDIAARLSQGNCMRVEASGDLSFLTDYLYECFQKRRRVIVLCGTKESADAWRETLRSMLTGVFGEICLVRIGKCLHLKNQEDIDILVTDADEFLQSSLQLIDPFWLSQVGFIILTDPHPFLARTGEAADVFFALWKQNTVPIQYLFLNCTMSAQEKQALEYYAGAKVHDVEKRAPGENERDRIVPESCELVPWLLASPAGVYRRLLLLMGQENGISEGALSKQKQRFGMESMTTEEFLKTILHTVLPDYPVQNIYDTFSFQEELQFPKGKWRIRLSDACAQELLRKDEAMSGIFVRRSGMSCYPDLIYTLEGASPLGSVIYQDEAAVQLYQAKIRQSCPGMFFVGEAKKREDYGRIAYEKYEQKQASVQSSAYEAVLLKLTVRCKDSTEKKALARMFAAVCNEVLEKVFPYNAGQITACCMEHGDSGKASIVPRMQSDFVWKDGLSVYLIENQNEHGLAAILHQNIRHFLHMCRAWLETAVNNPQSKEAAVMEYLMKQDRNEGIFLTDLENADQLAGPVRLLLGLLSE